MTSHLKNFSKVLTLLQAVPQFCLKALFGHRSERYGFVCAGKLDSIEREVCITSPTDTPI